jgi:hypothetical protein
VALERLQALALVWVPQNDLVVTPAAREKLAVKTPGDYLDPTAAIFSNIREHICQGLLRLSPADLGRQKKKAGLTCGPSTPSGARPCLGPTE